MTPTTWLSGRQPGEATIVERLRVKGVSALRVTPGSAAEAAGIRAARIREDGAIVPGDIIREVEVTPVDSDARY